MSAPADTRSVTGRGAFAELPPLGIAAVARRMELGRAKHGAEGYRAGIRLDVLFDKALRHAFQALAGETDEDHVAAAAANLLMIAEILERIRRGELPADLDSIGLAD